MSKSAAIGCRPEPGRAGAVERGRADMKSAAHEASEMITYHGMAIADSDNGEKGINSAFIDALAKRLRAEDRQRREMEKFICKESYGVGEIDKMRDRIRRRRAK